MHICRGYNYRHTCSHPRCISYLILLTSSRKSPPSTHFSSPPPPTPSPPPVPPPLTPQPSPTSPTTLAGRPPTTDPDATTIFAGIMVFGRILTFSLMIANWPMVTFSPMYTCDDIEMACIVQLGPKNVSNYAFRIVYLRPRSRSSWDHFTYQQGHCLRSSLDSSVLDLC